MEGTVDRIGAYAFAGLEALTKVTIEEGVTSIGGHFVMGCLRLASVAITGTVTEMGEGAFRGCSLLTSAGPIGSGSAVEFGWATEIPYHAFQNASQLTSVTLPDTLTTVGRYAFKQSGLTQLVVPDSVTMIGQYAFEKTPLVSANLGAGLELVGAGAFRLCRNLTEITLGSGLEEVGDQALEGCGSLRSVTIPETVTRLGDHAFAGCTGLEEVIFLGSVPVFDMVSSDNNEDIFLNVFANVLCYYDDSWTEKVMRNYGGNLNWVFREYGSVTEDALTWSYDTTLKQLTIRGSGLMADYFLNRGSVSTAPWQGLCQEARVIVLEEGITHIGNYAFCNFSELRQVVIPESVETIGQCAFDGCVRMPAVRIPSGLRSVGRYAFRGAKELKSVGFGQALEFVRSGAFEGCTGLYNLIFSGNAPSLGYKCFGSEPIDIRYPAAKDGWSNAKGNSDSVYHHWHAYGSADGEIARGTIGEGLTWVVDGDGVLTISGNGHIPDYRYVDDLEIPWCAYREKIVKIVVGEGIETLGSWIFRGIHYVTDISLPSSLISINEGAMDNKYCLVSLEIPDSVTTIGAQALVGASSLQYLTLGDSLVSLGDQAFDGNGALVQVQLPASLQSIGAGVFGFCSNLLRIQADPNSGSFWSDAQGVLYSKDKTTLYQMGAGFQGVYYVDASATAINERACSGVKELTAVTALGEITEIGSFAFSECRNLQSADLGSSIESIGQYAFFSCQQLAEACLGNRLTSIGDFAFSNCEMLRDIRFPDTLERIGEDAFNGCALTSVEFGNGLQYLGNNAFNGNNLTEVVLPASLQEVGTCVFQNCDQLTRVAIEPGLGYIGSRMFDGCDSLEIVELPDTITEIQESAFGSCVNLDSIMVPDSVTKIHSAFSGCTALSDVRMSANLVLLDEYAFSGCVNLAHIVLPPTLTTMKASCFGGCTALKKIIIPASLTVQSVSTVLYSTFSGCSGLETIIFLGDAPAIYLQYQIFYDVEATAYYPRDNATWTEEIRNGFGGTINWVPVTIYPMLENSDTRVTIGSGDPLTVHCAGALADLQEVWVDGMVVEPASYTTAEGSTIVTIEDAYLQNLYSGLHTVSLVFADGIAVDYFTLEGGSAHMHHYVSVVTEPTCQSQGYTTYTCECGYSYVANYVEGEHNYTTSVVTDPTCEEQGYTTHICGTCGYSYTDRYVDAIGHYYTGCTVNPTCEEEGYTTWRCSNCEHTYTEDYAPPLGHDYKDGVCTRCYQEDPGLDHEDEIQYPITGTCGGNLIWTLEADGTLTISGTGDMDDYDHMNLPPWNEYENEVKQVMVEGTVNRIGQRAFFNLQKLISVTIEDGVTEIGNSAFGLSTNLESITIPASVTFVDMYAFQECRKLTTAGPLGGGYAIEFGWTKEIPDQAFYYSDCLESVVLPSSVRVVGECAFMFSGIKQITLNDGLEVIDYCAFSGCYYLTSMEIPASVTEVGAGAFNECLALRDIYFRGHAPEMHSNSFDNVTATIWYPANDPSWENLWIMENAQGNLTWRSYDASDIPGDETEPTEPSDPEDPEMTGIDRLSGKNRYETGFAIANKLKEIMGVEKFPAVIVAYGQNFPDALTGSYLAAVKNAPILLTENSMDANVLSYIQQNVVSGGRVYILGGTAAVSQAFENGAGSLGFHVQRLKGADRYETNLAILTEAGVNTTDEVLIATGKNYADSLSASATGLPMLLVDKNLTDNQKAFLASTSKTFVILGGTSAVSAEVEAELDAIGDVTRVKGASRYGTSVEIAKRYFNAPSAAILAYAWNYPDGLCGGALAYAVGAPLILTSNESSQLADEYVVGISNGAVTGGTGRISEDTVREIFDLPANTPIGKPY